MTDKTKTVVLTREEEIKLISARKKKDSFSNEALHTLLNAHDNFIKMRAHAFVTRFGRRFGVTFDDLHQEGRIGFIKAVDGFDKNKKCRLLSYAVWWIDAYMARSVMDQVSAVKYGTTRNQRDRIMGSMRTQDVLIASGVREPLADLSLNVPISIGNNETTTWIDAMASSTYEPTDDRLAESEIYRSREERLAIALAKLEEKSPIETAILRMRALADEPATLDEIGSHFGFSRERAHQLEAQALNKIRKYIGLLSDSESVVPHITANEVGFITRRRSNNGDTIATTNPPAAPPAP